jgi:hypothetical protein
MRNAGNSSEPPAFLAERESYSIHSVERFTWREVRG